MGATLPEAFIPFKRSPEIAHKMFACSWAQTEGYRQLRKRHSFFLFVALNRGP